MEIILLGIYFTIVWLIFIKFKLLPWNTPVKVIVFTIPVVGIATLILSLNVYAPSSADVRVVKYVIPIVPQVKGRVIEVPVEPNRPVKKGDELFRIDPTPYELQVRTFEAQLANAMGLTRQSREQLKQAEQKTKAIQPQIDLAEMRVKQNRELVSTGAGNRFDLERAEADLKQLQAEQAAAEAAAAQVREKLSSTVGEQADQAEVAEIKALLENAKWELSQTVMYAPADGYAINLQLRPGAFVAAIPLSPVMSFVENEYQVYALFYQNELRQIEPGNEAEFNLETFPGRIFKASVDSIVWAQGQGQIAMSGTIPQTGFVPTAPDRFPVKFTVDKKDRDTFFPAGAIGHGAVYTNHGKMIHIVRKIILRVGAYMDYLILKLH